MVKRCCFILHVSIIVLLFHQGNPESPCDFGDDVLCKKEDSANGFARTRASRHAPGYCPEGWYTLGDKCFKGFGISSGDRTTWSRADEACAALDSSLVTIHSADEQDLLKLLAVELRYDTWIGLHRSSSGDGNDFYWKDSSPLDFTNWADEEPNNYAGAGENCVHMHYGRFEVGLWNDAPCGLRLSYICQRPKDLTLTRPAPYPALCSEPEGWLRLRTSCYKVFDKTESYASWFRAQSLCKSYGGNLVYVKSWAVTTLLRFHLEGLKGPFWTGIKSTRMHKYTWLGTHPLVYSNWQSDQPKGVEDHQACVATDEEGEWMVRDCDENHPFICEVTTESLEAPTIGPFRPHMTCPYTSPKWHDLGGQYCYIIDVGAKLKWREASCRCTEEGGSLASFHSTSEVNVIRHYVKHHNIPLHIGFRRNTQGGFVWSDGSAADFFNWNYGEPSNLEEQCAEMKTDTGRWNDVNCNNRVGYICSAPKVLKRRGSVPTNELIASGASLGAADVTFTVTCILTAMAASEN